MAINIAIDGTAGSGKGTLADLVAKKRGFYHLDTGSIYRSVAYFMLRNKVDITCEKDVVKNLKKIKFEIIFDSKTKKQINLVNGIDLGDKIRTEDVSRAASIVSQYKKIREFATKIQRKIAKNYDIIIEGRDIGTVVLPKAKYKFFITAAPEVRARRRLLQLHLPESEFDKVLADIIARDKRDMEREISPLKQAEDAVLIDNSNDTIEQTVKRICSKIKN